MRWPALARELRVATVLANRDYEPDAKRRDAEVGAALQDVGVAFQLFKDQVIFDGDKILTQAGIPFSVYTPCKNAWLKALAPADLAAFVPGPDDGVLAFPPSANTAPILEQLGFERTNLGRVPVATGMRGGARLFEEFLRRIDRYHQMRDYPAAIGCDAQPWFRIFNPVTQSERFDPNGEFIRRHGPELAALPAPTIHAPWKMSAPQQRAADVVVGRDYPHPIVDHDVARKFTLALYRLAPSETP